MYGWKQVFEESKDTLMGRCCADDLGSQVMRDMALRNMRKSIVANSRQQTRSVRNQLASFERVRVTI